MEAAQWYVKAGHTRRLRKYGEACPPVATLRDWSQQLSVQADLNPTGHPGKRTKEDSEALPLCCNGVRQEGAGLDRECISLSGFVDRVTCHSKVGEKPKRFITSLIAHDHVKRKHMKHSVG